MISQSPPKEIKGLYFALYCGTLDLLASMLSVYRVSHLKISNDKDNGALRLQKRQKEFP